MSYKNCPLPEVLDDLAVRFIINIPEEELCDIIRISFQIEEAHWFFEDFVRVQNPLLPSFSLRTFSLTFFKHLDFLNQYVDQHDEIYSQFLSYKFRVPVCGAIILNPTLDKALFVKGWSGRASWGFPRGKINIGEQDVDCAVREVIEEVGFDIRQYMTKNQYLEVQLTQQRVRLYIIPCIPETMEFNPKTRKEISKIEWHPLSRFLNSKANRTATVLHDHQDNQNYRYFMVAPFINQLTSWVKKYRFSDKYFDDLAKHGQNQEILNYYYQQMSNGVDLHSLVKKQKVTANPTLNIHLPPTIEYDMGAVLDRGHYIEDLPPSEAGPNHPWNCFEFSLPSIFSQ